jgi:hypothetical protein
MMLISLLRFLLVVSIRASSVSEKYLNEHLNRTRVFTYNTPTIADGFNILVRAVHTIEPPDNVFFFSYYLIISITFHLNCRPSEIV